VTDPWQLICAIHSIEPEDHATKSRDYGRGFADAIRRVREVMYEHGVSFGKAEKDSGARSTPVLMCCSAEHENVPAYYLGVYEDDREYPDTPYCKSCGDQVVRLGEYRVTRVLGKGHSQT
jgi:hypothetical protein